MQTRFNGLEQRTARLEGGFEQMDKRLGTFAEQVDKRISKIEGEMGDLRKDVRQVLFVVLGTWVTVMLTLLLKSA